MSYVSIVQIRTEQHPLEQSHSVPARPRALKPAKQRGFTLEAAYPPPGVDAEENMWRSRHRLGRAVAEFFRRNPSREFFVAAIETVRLDVPALTLSRRVVVAHHRKCDCWPPAKQQQLWICVAGTDAETHQFYLLQVDEETAFIAFDLLSKFAEFSAYLAPIWDLPYGDWKQDHVAGAGPRLSNFPRGLLTGEAS